MLRLCIPVHNEAPTIGVLLWRIRKVFQEFSREYDVTVFDDASSDGTAELLEPYRAVMPLTVLSAPRRVGYARAVDALVRHVAADDEYARRDAMVLLQGDFTDQPEQLPELVKRFEGGADVVAVARTTDEAMPADERRLRRWGTWAVRPFLKLPPFDDPFGGFRLVRIAVLRDLLRAAAAEPVCRGDDPWAANADFALTLAPFARRIENVSLPGRYDVRPRPSHHRAWPDTLMLFRWARGARRLSRPVPRPAGKGEGRERSAEIARPAGVEYVASTAPPPPRPPRPTREEIAASEVPSRRARRPAPPVDLTERPAPRPEPAERKREREQPAGARSEAKGEARGDSREPRREKPARPPRGEATRPDAAPTESATPAHDHHRQLRRVARHPHHEPGAGESAPLAHDAAPPAEDVVLAQADGSGLAEPGTGEGAPAKKKRRRRRKKRGGAAALDGATTEGGLSADGADGADDGDDADDGEGAERDGSAASPAVARAPRPRPTPAPRPQADGDTLADDEGDPGDDGDDAAGDEPSADFAEGAEPGDQPRKRRRPRRRRRRPRPSGAGDGVVEGGAADASSPAAPAPVPPAGADD